MEQLNTLGLAHAFLRAHVRQGDFCIDATAGRGRDTALLCELVGETGKVLSFDVQPEAISQTQALLRERGFAQAEVVLDSHANMGNYAEEGSVSCIVFNFGRLPGGDPQIFTQAESSVKAIAAGLALLRPGGVMSLSIYYGGPNGYAERDAILSYLAKLNDREVSVLVSQWHNRPHCPPISAMLWKA